MDPRYTTLLLSALSGACFAQNGVLTYDEMPPVGTTITYLRADDPDIIDTTSGAGVTWDMGDLMPDLQPPFEVYYLAPASTPHPTDFPTSNYCTQGESPYVYYDLNAATMELVGTYLLDPITYTNTRIELTFPLQLGTTSNDLWYATGMSFDGTYVFTCIGSGTLILPAGTYDDVLLLRISAYPSGSSVIYRWLDASSGATLLSYALALFGNPNDATYTMDATIGIDEAHAPIELRLQGLVNDELHVTYVANEPVDATIIGMSGAVLRHDRLPATAAPLTLPLDVAGIAPGMYCLELRGASGRHVATRFVRM